MACHRKQRQLLDVSFLRDFLAGVAIAVVFLVPTVALGQAGSLTATTPVVPQPETMAPPTALTDLTSQNPYSGSITTEKVVPGSISLTLLDAINRGLRYNLGLYTSVRSEETVQGERLRALANLLPNVSARATETEQQLDLATFGITVPGFPTVVGPFGVADFRAAATAPVFNLEALNRLRSANQNRNVAKFTYQNSRELVVVAVGLSYVQSQAAEARVEAVQAELNTAQSLYKLAVDQKNAGVAPAIDVLRAQVEMQAQQERLVTAQNNFDKQKLQLARVIGLPTAQEFTLAQKIPYTPAPPLTLEDAIAEALRNRPDYAAAQSRIRAAEYSIRAAKSERMPTLGVNGDYGIIGTNTGSFHGTFTAGAAVQVPIFTGGRVPGDIQVADSALKLAKAEAEDLRSRIEYEVRTAFLDLKAASQQVEVAKSSLSLANETLTQAQDRFRAGVTNNIEVIQAQESVASSNEAFITSTLDFNLAKLALARSLGVAERATKEFLGGTP